MTIKESEKRDLNLIRKVVNITNSSEWLALNTNNQQHSAIAMIVTLALIEEATEPGIFNQRL